MKKIIASLIAIAMFVSVAAVFTGCDSSKVSGKTYAQQELVYTVITEVADEADEEGNFAIKTKMDLTESEMTKIRYVWNMLHKTDKSVADAKAYTFTAEEQKDYDEYLKARPLQSKAEATFKNGKMTLSIIEIADAFDNEYEIQNIYGTYEVNDKVLSVKTADSFSDESENESEYGNATYSIMLFTIGEDMIIQVSYADGIKSDRKDFQDYVFSYTEQSNYYCVTANWTLVK